LQLSIWGSNERRTSAHEISTTIGEEAIKYLCLVYCEEKLESLPDFPGDTEYLSYAEALKGSGRLIAVEPLQSVQTTTSVRVRNGKVSGTDCPFAEGTVGRVLPRQGPERGHPGSLEDPAGASGQHRGAAGQGVAVTRTRPDSAVPQIWEERRRAVEFGA